MKFLSAYVDKNYEPPSTKYLVTKKKSEKAQINDFDLLTPELSKRDSASG